MNTETTFNTHTYLTFKLGNEHFASSVNNVLNILELVPITKVPKAPGYMKGVINLRGAVLPVIDTRIKFGMEPTVENANTAILVLSIQADGHEIKLGAMVDSVDEVIELEPHQIQPAPTIGTKYNTDFIEGMAQKNQGFIMILNMDKVFSTDEILEIAPLNQTA
jgi:purine-binding chemotaxis protein CheW